jgi:chitinase
MFLIFKGMKHFINAMLLSCCLQLSAQQNNAPKIIAYYTGSGETIKQYPVAKLTHIIYSFLKLQNDTLTFHNEQQRKSLQQLVALKKEYPQLKIMVSIGGWGGCAPCSDLFSSAEHRSVFAKTSVALFKEYNIDGLDLDWEYPAIEGYPGHKYDVKDRENFTLLVAALRKEMGTDYLLSFAAGGFVQFLEQSIEWEKVIPLLDFVNLMTYDLVGGYSTVTGHHTPLSDYQKDQQSTEKCVNWLLNKKMPAEKLIIGAAFYARVWENVSPENNGLYQSGKFKQGVSYKNFYSFFSDSLGYTYYWDERAKAPFRYSHNKKLFATFDDKMSIREKSAFIKQKKLGGIMFWELSDDQPVGGLTDEIYRALKN